MELKDKGYHFPCVLDRHVFLATMLNFWPGPIIAILIYIPYTVIEKKEKSQSAEAELNALYIWYSSFTEKNSSHSPACSEKRLMFSCEINFYKNGKILFTSRLFFVKMNSKTKQTNTKKHKERREGMYLNKVMRISHKTTCFHVLSIIYGWDILN